ncbi:MAG: hypothetical protein IKG18_14135 [Atopobiaceae bacterium]|nr:hypothetical protein [Atopobiaceae bacterium]
MRFLLSLQGCGVDFVADAPYVLMIPILLACEDMTCRSKTDYRGKMRSILAWVNSVGLFESQARTAGESRSRTTWRLSATLRTDPRKWLLARVRVLSNPLPQAVEV